MITGEWIMDYFKLIEFLKQYNKGVAQGNKYNQYSIYFFTLL